jgi:WD40 repeat protein
MGPVGIKDTVRVWCIKMGPDSQGCLRQAQTSSPELCPLAWKFATRDSVETVAALSPDNTTLLVGSVDFHLYAVDAATGQAKWNFTAGKPFVPSAYASPCLQSWEMLM